MTLQEIKNRRLAQYLKAEEAILRGQSYTIGERSLTRADLSSVRKAIDDLISDGAYLDEEPLKSGRTRRVVFIDG